MSWRDYEVPESGRERLRRYVNRALPYALAAGEAGLSALAQKLATSGVKRALSFNAYPNTPPNKRRAIPASPLSYDPIPYSQLSSSSRQGYTSGFSKMPGFYSKKFRVRRVNRIGLPAKSGFERFTEKGGTVTDPSVVAGATEGCVYVGHGVARAQVAYAALGAILRKLALKCGFQFSSWSALVQTAEDIGNPTLIGGIVTIYFKRGNETAPSAQIGANVTAAITWGTLLDSLFGGLNTASASDFTELQFTEAFWFRNDGSNQLPVGRINLLGAKVKVEFSSNIKIQNQTLSEGVDTTDNVDANPIHGKVYEGMGNGFKLGFANLATTPVDQYVKAEPTNGLINFNWSDGALAMDHCYRRPPSKSGFLGTYKMGATRLQPGQIRTGYLSYSKVVSLDYVIGAYMRAEKLGAKSRFQFGKCQLFGFEKHIHQTLTSSAITLSYEINQRYGAVLIQKAVGALPERLVYTT